MPQWFFILTYYFYFCITILDNLREQMLNSEGMNGNQIHVCQGFSGALPLTKHKHYWYP